MLRVCVDSTVYQNSDNTKPPSDVLSFTPSFYRLSTTYRSVDQFTYTSSLKKSDFSLKQYHDCTSKKDFAPYL